MFRGPLRISPPFHQRRTFRKLLAGMPFVQPSINGIHIPLTDIFFLFDLYRIAGAVPAFA